MFLLLHTRIVCRPAFVENFIETEVQREGDDNELNIRCA
jgi:hypothetical protein